MEIYKIAFIAVYIIALGIYMHTETAGVFFHRAVNKIFLSTMFFAYFIFHFNDNFTEDKTCILALLGFGFAFLGDIILLFNFVKGAVAFSVGNIFFVAYEICLLSGFKAGFGNIIWSLIIFIILSGGLHLARRKNIINYGKFGSKLPAYMLTVTAQGSLGLSVLLSGSEFRHILFGLGLMLFMVSDYFIVTYKIYREKNWVLRSNSTLYFMGMLLGTLSFSF